MLQLTFKQTNSEMLVRAAASVLFGTLIRHGAKLVSISDLAGRPQYGFTASAAIESVGPKFVRITDLQDGKIDWDSVPFCECAEPEKYLLQDDDLLFARTGATTGKTHLVKDAERAVFASYLIRLRPKPGVFAGYLHAFFQSDPYWTQISDEKEGSAQPNVNGEKLAALEIPRVDLKLQHAIAEFLRCVRSRQDGEKVELPELPAPLAEQRRVVERIDELAAQIHEACTLRHDATEEAEALTTAKTTHIFEGLVKGDRHPINTLGSGSENPIQIGPFGAQLHKTEFVEEGVPVLNVGNVWPDGLRLDYLDHVTEEKAHQLRRYSINTGDLLFARSGATLGKVCLVPQKCDGWLMTGHLFRVRFDSDRVFNRFAFAALRGSLQIQEQIFGQVRGATRPGYNTTLLGNVELPVPPLAEQRRIVAELDALQAEVDSLKRLQAETAAELDALLPAILDRAFKGEL